MAEDGHGGGSLGDSLVAQLKDEIAHWQDGYELLFDRHITMVGRLRQAVQLFDRSARDTTAMRIFENRCQKILIDLAGAVPKVKSSQEVRTEHLQQRAALR